MNIKENYIKRASSFINEQEENFSKERINKIVQNAMDSFWASVVNDVLEAKTGDFPPDAQQAFLEACDLAVRTWINHNTDEDPVM